MNEATVLKLPIREKLQLLAERFPQQSGGDVGHHLSDKNSGDLKGEKFWITQLILSSTTILLAKTSPDPIKWHAAKTKKKKKEKKVEQICQPLSSKFLA